MELYLDFACEWWNSLYGVRFDRDYYFDPDINISRRRLMDAALRERFPWYDEYRPDAPVYSAEPFGHRFIPAMFGCEIAYADAAAPWAENHILSPEAIEAMPMLSTDEYARDEKVKTVAELTGYARKKYGRCHGGQNLGSVMNTAIYLRGMDLFTDFYERPAAVEKLFGLITNRMILSYEYGAALDGSYPDTGVGNCAVCMISPEIYENFVYRHDRAMMELAARHNVRFGVHHDSDATPYIGCYRRFEYLHHFDVGCETDIRSYRENFPGATLNIYLYTHFLAERTSAGIIRDVAGLAALSGDRSLTRFTCADIDSGVPDEKVNALYEAVKK